MVWWYCAFAHVRGNSGDKHDFLCVFTFVSITKKSCLFSFLAIFAAEGDAASDFD